MPLTQIKTSDEQTRFVTEIIPMLRLEESPHAESIRYVVSELVRNVLEHSESKDGATVAAQYHKKSNVIRIGIADTGVGIKRTINHSHQAWTDMEALKLALTPGITGTKNKRYLRNSGRALRLVSTITKVTQLQKGDAVSYNYTFTAPNAMTIGVLPLSYYEGLSRALSNVGVVKVGRRFTPIVGNVCMDHTMISLDDTSAKVGDEVVVFSNNPQDPSAIDAIAAKHTIFNYVLLTNLSSDVRRVLVE